MEKKYLCSWDSRYYLMGKAVVRHIDFFSEESGYLQADISIINNMKIGDFLEADKGHFIIRIN